MYVEQYLGEKYDFETTVKNLNVLYNHLDIQLDMLKLMRDKVSMHKRTAEIHKLIELHENILKKYKDIDTP